MAEVQEVFLEFEWEDELAARQARDDRASQLQEQGYVTTCENLWNVNGQRVFLVKAAKAERIEVTRGEEGEATRSRNGGKGDRPPVKRRDRMVLNYETR